MSKTREGIEVKVGQVWQADYEGSHDRTRKWVVVGEFMGYANLRPETQLEDPRSTIQARTKQMKAKWKLIKDVT